MGVRAHSQNWIKDSQNYSNFSLSVLLLFVLLIVVLRSSSYSITSLLLRFQSNFFYRNFELIEPLFHLQKLWIRSCCCFFFGSF
ncbi:hypothetical protein MIMGU_mgv1a017304mg [Erythranthe guttata]|uniref:Uncharacterized protein n=1 Tax=Erythranthe guttata TaxID=4155 RepID=A0A022QBI9_ERYGU|nr:hypothetical protein MIMGU_mgv1a017304mg [Erythranthe guttata]